MHYCMVLVTQDGAAGMMSYVGRKSQDSRPKTAQFGKRLHQIDGNTEKAVPKWVGLGTIGQPRCCID